jgi:hypothetical protein
VVLESRLYRVLASELAANLGPLDGGSPGDHTCKDGATSYKDDHVLVTNVLLT